MENEEIIKTDNELEFAVFCIENIAIALKTDAKTVYRALVDQSDILKEYIVPFYDVLHTQGKEYIVNDILELMEKKGVTV